MIKRTLSTQALFSSLDDLLNQHHPLYKLSNKINWQVFDQEFASLYCPDNGHPAKPIHLMYGLLILRHLSNLSDESVVEQWSKNAYYQYFCGAHEFVPSYLCNASELVHFRHRIGEKGIELIFAESIRVNDDDPSGKGDKNGSYQHYDSGEKYHLSYRCQIALRKSYASVCK